MGLIRSFSFPSEGSIEPTYIHPCSHSPLLLSLTQSHISPGHTSAGPLVLFISCPSVHGPQISLLSFFLPSLSVYTISICLMYSVPFAVPAMSIFRPSLPCLYLLPLLLLSYQLFSSFFLVSSVPPSHLSLPSHFFSAPPHPHTHTLYLFFLSKSPLMCFIGAVCNSLPAHFSWLRCSTTFKYNIESVMQKRYRA